MPKPTNDPGPISFTAIIQQSDASGAAGFIAFPYDLKKLYGIGNLVPVVATFDGIEYRGSIAKMGPDPLLLIRKDVRQKLGKGAGESVEVIVTLDKSKREIAVPDDLGRALEANPRSEENFERLSYSHRREYVQWINDAKREVTRESRVAKAIEMLSQNKRLK
jgi:bifunctional DNA-binding transcriptional regulator/antitoxin component of YhaV-PrlF toxin-antitoxin module